MESTSPAPITSLPQPPKARPRSARRAFTILGAVFAALLAGVGVYLFLTRNQEETDDAQIEADVEPIAPRVSGAVLSVAARDNQRVAAGALLITIDPADYEAREKQAEADLALARAEADAAFAQVRIIEASAHGGLTAAEAALAGSTVGVGSAKASVEAARAAVARAQANAHKARLDLDRARQLFADRAVPQDRLEATQAAADASAAALAQAKAQFAAALDAQGQAVSRVAEAKGRLGIARPIDAEIAAARAQAAAAAARVSAAEAALALKKLDLGYTRVVAPIAGIVSKLHLQPGQLLAAGQPIAELVPTAIYVEANFKETQVGRMRPGQRASFEVDAFPGRSFAGKVQSLSGGTGARFSLLPPDNASGNFVKVVQRMPVRIEITDPPANLLLAAGLSADVTVYEN